MWPHIYLLICVLVLVEGVFSRKSNIGWISPTKGESFGLGDRIVCKWTTDKAVVSPSFQLCMLSEELALDERGDDEDTDSEMDCGDTIWPTVQQSGDEYTISLGVPDVAAEGRYTLQMKDDFGTKFKTSSFSLRATPTAATDSTSNPSSDGVQVPLGSVSDSRNSPATAASDSSNADTSSPTTVASTVDSTAAPLSKSSDDANLNSSATVPSDSSASRPHPSTPAGQSPSKSESLKGSASSPVPAASTSRAVNISSPSATPQDLATRRPPSTAALAIPLSAIGAILVIAAGLAFRHRQKLSEERMRDTEKLALSRQSSISGYKSAGEVQYALDVLSRHDIDSAATLTPVPLLMPVRREPRRSTKKAFALSSYVAPTPSVRRPGSVNKSRSRPLLMRSGLSSLSDVDAFSGSNDTANSDEDPATHSVIADYILPSPPLPSSLLAAPQRVHVRKEAADHPAPLHKDNYDDKPLPPSPRS